MSPARFDTGHDLSWEPMPLAHLGISVSDSPSGVVTLDPTSPAGQIIRVDYLSLVLRLAGTDANAGAELCLETILGVYPAILAVDLLLTNGILRATAQLTLPFYVVDVTHVVIRGFYSGAGSSNLDGTCAYSRAFTSS